MWTFFHHVTQFYTDINFCTQNSTQKMNEKKKRMNYSPCQDITQTKSPCEKSKNGKTQFDINSKGIKYTVHEIY
jgi:hypothetical protein